MVAELVEQSPGATEVDPLHALHRLDVGGEGDALGLEFGAGDGDDVQGVVVLALVTGGGVAVAPRLTSQPLRLLMRAFE